MSFSSGERVCTQTCCKVESPGQLSERFCRELVRALEEGDTHGVESMESFPRPPWVHYADRQGRTALHLAAKKCHAPVLAALLLLGADPDARDAKGVSPLHMAAAKRDFHAACSAIDIQRDMLLCEGSDLKPFAENTSPEERAAYSATVVCKGNENARLTNSSATSLDFKLPGSCFPVPDNWIYADAEPEVADKAPVCPEVFPHSVFSSSGVWGSVLGCTSLANSPQYFRGLQTTPVQSTGLPQAKHPVRNAWGADNAWNASSCGLTEDRHNTEDLALCFVTLDSVGVAHSCKQHHRRKKVSVAAVVEASEKSAVHLLHLCGAELDGKNKDGRTPLHLAAWKGIESSVDALVSLGASLFVQDRDGRQPLHLACISGSLQVCIVPYHTGFALD